MDDKLNKEVEFDVVAESEFSEEKPKRVFTKKNLVFSAIIGIVIILSIVSLLDPKKGQEVPLEFTPVSTIELIDLETKLLEGEDFIFLYGANDDKGPVESFRVYAEYLEGYDKTVHIWNRDETEMYFGNQFISENLFFDLDFIYVPTLFIVKDGKIIETLEPEYNKSQNLEHTHGELRPRTYEELDEIFEYLEGKKTLEEISEVVDDGN